MAGADRRVGSRGRWIGDASVYHGEGAFWDAGTQALRYVDMLSGDVMTEPEAGAAAEAEHPSRRTHLGDVVALIRRRRSGGYVIAAERGFVLLDEHLRAESAVPVFTDPDVRMNEGACDAAGRLYCGSMAYDMRAGGGCLYRLDPDLSVHVVLRDVTIPNGLVWTLDGTRALHAETGDGRVYSSEFDLSAGAFGAREVFLDFADSPGVPDGMALDAEGGLWIAMWGGAAVHRYDADGSLTHVIDLPVSNPTSCAFGGTDGTTLFVTTSRQEVPAGAQPLAGRVYAVDVGVRGADVHPFGG